MPCNSCGKELETGVSFCPYCGKEVERFAAEQADQKPRAFCRFCGSEIVGVAAFCPSCGKATTVDASLVQLHPDSDDKPYDDGIRTIFLFFPIVGFILFLVHIERQPTRAKDAGAVSLVGSLVWFSILMLLQCTGGLG